MQFFYYLCNLDKNIKYSCHPGKDQVLNKI